MTKKSRSRSHSRNKKNRTKRGGVWYDITSWFNKQEGDSTTTGNTTTGNTNQPSGEPTSYGTPPPQQAGRKRKRTRKHKRKHRKTQRKH